MIKFWNPEETELVIIDGVDFYLRPISVRTKFEILTALSSLQEKTEADTDDSLFGPLNKLKEILGQVVESVMVNGELLPFENAFERFREIDDIKKVQTEVLRYCSLTEAQRKNSDSSPEQPSPVLAGNAEINAVPDGAPVGIIPA